MVWLVWFYQAAEARLIDEPTLPTRKGKKRTALVVEPDLVGVIPETVIVTNLKGRVSEESLPNVELPGEWVPPETMTLVWLN